MTPGLDSRILVSKRRHVQSRSYLQACNDTPCGWDPSLYLYSHRAEVVQLDRNDPNILQVCLLRLEQGTGSVEAKTGQDRREP